MFLSIGSRDHICRGSDTTPAASYIYETSMEQSTVHCLTLLSYFDSAGELLSTAQLLNICEVNSKFTSLLVLVF